jgi:hypothetical protein
MEVELNKKLPLILVAVILAFPSVINPQSSTARFLYWQPSAEIMSMGGAGSALVENGFPSYYNPASLAFNKKFGFAVSFVQPHHPFKNTAHSFIAVSYPFREIGTFALSLNSFWIESQFNTLELGPEAVGIANSLPELFNPTHLQLKLSYGNKATENISYGVSISYLSINISDVPAGIESDAGSASTVLFDGGALIKDVFPNTTYSDIDKNKLTFSDISYSKGFSFGLSIQNFGPGISFIDADQEDKPPFKIVLGLTYSPIITNYFGGRILIDFENRIYDKMNLIHFGNEITLLGLLYLRSGYSINTYEGQGNFFTYGIGAKYKFISVNIARYNQFFLPAWHFDIKINPEF